jgi:hypothetical protein
MSTDAPEHLLSGALIEELRRSAAKTVQVYVARNARRSTIQTCWSPRRLGTACGCVRGELDAEGFECQVADGREALAAGRADHAPRRCARRWDCGGDRRSRISPQRRSRQLRSRA